MATHSWTQPLKMSTGCWGQRLMQVSREPPGQSPRPPVEVVTGCSVVVVGELTIEYMFPGFPNFFNVPGFVEAGNC